MIAVEITLALCPIHIQPQCSTLRDYKGSHFSPQGSTRHLSAIISPSTQFALRTLPRKLKPFATTDQSVLLALKASIRKPSDLPSNVFLNAPKVTIKLWVFANKASPFHLVSEIKK